MSVFTQYFGIYSTIHVLHVVVVFIIIVHKTTEHVFECIYSTDFIVSNE